MPLSASGISLSAPPQEAPPVVWEGYCKVTPSNPNYQIDGSTDGWGTERLGGEPVFSFDPATQADVWTYPLGVVRVTAVELDASTVRIDFQVQNESDAELPFLMFEPGRPVGEILPHTSLTGLKDVGNFVESTTPNRWAMYSWPQSRELPCCVVRTSAASFGLHFAGRMEQSACYVQNGPAVCAFLETHQEPHSTATYSLVLHMAPADAPYESVFAHAIAEWRTLKGAGLNYDPNLAPVMGWYRYEQSHANAGNPYGFINWFMYPNGPDVDEEAAFAAAVPAIEAAAARGCQGVLCHAGFAYMPWSTPASAVDTADLDVPAWRWYRRLRRLVESHGMKLGGGVRFCDLPDQGVRLERIGELIYGDTYLTEAGGTMTAKAAELAAARAKIGRDTQIWLEFPHLLTIQDAGIYQEMYLPLGHQLSDLTKALRAFYPTCGVLGVHNDVADVNAFRSECAALGAAPYVMDSRITELTQGA